MMTAILIGKFSNSESGASSYQQKSREKVGNRTSERQISSWMEYKNTDEIDGARFQNKISGK